MPAAGLADAQMRVIENMVYMPENPPFSTKTNRRKGSQFLAEIASSNQFDAMTVVLQSLSRIPAVLPPAEEQEQILSQNVLDKIVDYHTRQACLNMMNDNNTVDLLEEDSE